ncbi:hypothetical protein SAMN05216205_0647 [Pseudomonas mohnii]|jgi:hypothetical protein|uniref:Uncharacterized protein n=1 Tax=Pseudomonas mohnii TaxID=395600 RepID=A0ABY0XP08_9PSED|nr:hypothetical protein SAMN05216205_0647 [Pseudomonas mohnii]
MTSAISSSTHITLPQTPAIKHQKPPTVQIDSDGDHDGSKPGEVEQTKATSGSIGTRINTTA